LIVYLTGTLLSVREVPGGVTATLRVQKLLYRIVKVQANQMLAGWLRYEASDLLDV
jgi:hypothetical protein